MADLVIDDTIEAIVLPNGEELELGKTPTGNIDITQAGVTNVSDYATATVPTGTITNGIFSASWYGSNINVYHNVGKIAGYISGGTQQFSGVLFVRESKTVTPSAESQTVSPTNTSYYLESVTVNPIPSQYIVPSGTKSITSNGTGIDVAQYASVDVAVQGSSPTLQSKTKSYTPTETAQTESVTADGGYDGLDTVSISVAAIPSNYVGSGITQRSSSDLTASGATVTVPSGHYSAQATKTVASGTAGTPTATKGTVSNHSVSVTPSVTNTTGYITGSTKTGTAVTVSASELVSGNLPITENGNNIDCANYSTVSVNVPTGGSVNIDTKTVTATNYPVSISFSSMKGQPKAFFLRSTTQISSSGSTAYYYIIDMRYNGTNTTGNCFRIGSTRRVENITSGYSWSYSGTTLTITSSASSRSYSPGAFNNGYELTYVY